MQGKMTRPVGSHLPGTCQQWAGPSGQKTGWKLDRYLLVFDHCKTKAGSGDSVY